MLMQKNQKSSLAIAALLSLSGSFAVGTSEAHADARSKAQRLFDRLAGVPIPMSDPRFAQMQALIAAGNLDGAAKIATADDNFYNITLKHFALPMSSPTEDPVQPLNDFAATLIGVVRDDLDGRELLTGNYIYKADNSVNFSTAANPIDIQTDAAIYRSNNHYEQLERRDVNLRQVLVKAPQKAATSNAGTTLIEITDNGGLMTTRAWAQSMYSGGTNRRGVQYAYQEFLCTPLSAVADASLPDDRIRRDLPRNPAGDVRLFMSNCRSCHTIMDSIGGALAHFDWNDGNGGFMIFTPGAVVGKMNRAGNTYPAGFVTTDNSWVNYGTVGHNASLGWGGTNSGRGINAMGAMFAATEQFPMCMAKRVFTEVCRRPPSTKEASQISSLASEFKSSGYKLKRVFEKAAVIPACLGD